MPSVYNQRQPELVPPDAVYVGRPSKWGNPFKIGVDGTRFQVIAKYEAWLQQQVALGKLNVEELRGKDLVCWCAPAPCHGDVLLQRSNA